MPKKVAQPQQPLQQQSLHSLARAASDLDKGAPSSVSAAAPAAATGAPQQQRPDGSKRVKREPLASPGGLGGGLGPDGMPPAKRSRNDLPPTTTSRTMAPAVGTTGPGTAPSPVRARAPTSDLAPLVPSGSSSMLASPAPGGSTSNLQQKPRKPKRGNGGEGIAWVLSEVRNQLESISDVEGVPELLERFPECVLLGGIAARRELVAALLGQHGVAASAAALLVAPGMRQPVALELRCGSEDFGPAQGPEAEGWLRSVAQAAAQALGQRLKVDTLRLRLSAMGCANLDVIDLPERQGQAGMSPKIEEMRTKHAGSTSNLLVCLEPGPYLDLCKRFDPALKRTVLIGAANSAEGVEGELPPQVDCGPAAAKALEDRFAQLCHERLPQWLRELERLEMRLSRSQREAREVEKRETREEVLRHARAAGISFGRALQHVVGGTPGCHAGALTLEEELNEFYAAASKGACGCLEGGKGLTPEEAKIAAEEVFANFDGPAGYAAYLRDEVKVPGADVQLNGGAAWQRLLAEIEVSMRLAHPPPEELQGLMLASIRAGGTGVHGHQRWEDVASKLMLSVSFEPLRRRVRYVAARVVWVLKHQKATVSEWMSMLSDGPSARLHSPLFGQHLDVLRTYPIVRELVFNAYDSAASKIGQQVLRNLEGTLVAACINPDIMLRPSTEPDLGEPKAPTSKSSGSSRSSNAETRKRVASEMRCRSGRSGGLPVQLRDRVFEPGEAARTVPFVEAKLRKAFSALATILANQAFAFADTSMSYLCHRHVDEAMSAIDFTEDQSRAVTQRHEELEAVAKQVEQRLQGVKRCIAALRGVRQ